MSGGAYTIASESCASVSGGYKNEAVGPYSAVSGGKYNEGGHGNVASADDSSILGGDKNEISSSNQYETHWTM